MESSNKGTFAAGVLCGITSFATVMVFVARPVEGVRAPAPSPVAPSLPPPSWQVVASDESRYAILARVEVPGGWIYATGSGIAFVPSAAPR